jgi:hypothetical protein
MVARVVLSPSFELLGLGLRREGKHMFSTTITFLADSTKLPRGSGGTSLQNATGIGHPNMTVDQSGLPLQTNVLGDTPVKIGPGEEVQLLVIDANGLLNVRLAPCALMVHDFNGSIPDMTNGDTRPINVPEFDVNYANVPYLDYKTPNDPQWGTVPSNYQNWPGVPMISQLLNASNKQIYAPFIDFRGSSVSATGSMQYGLVFVLTRDGDHQEYFYFDPFLVINSSTRGLGQSQK